MRPGVIAILAIMFAALSVWAYSSHAPIAITADSDFTPANGVIGGSGTPEDPYIIAGWEIDAANGTGILVRGTSVRFVIRDCRITGTPRGTGISLVEVQAGIVEACEFSGLGVGVFAYRAAGIEVKGSRFVRCRRGIDGSESPRLTVEGNRFLEMKKEGVFLWHCHDALIRDNLFHSGGTAVYLDSCHRDRLEHNLVQGSNWGLFLWDSFDCVIAGNLVRDCRLGVALVHTSARNSVFHNAFLNCERPAACDGPGNRWDNGYPAGGNYWGDIGLEDRFSGPGQDKPGPDGIGDTSVEVPLVCMDRYPLMKPPPEITDLEEER